MSDKKNWVDFRQVRESVNFADVLEAYGVTLRLQGPQHHGFCPLPGHDGQRRSPSFSAHLEKKAFQCFGCGAKGNAIDFVALMEGLDPAQPLDIRKAALLVQERFLGQAPQQSEDEGKPPEKPRHKPPRPGKPPKGNSAPSEALPQKEPDNRPHVINAPLDFELTGLDPNHPYLKERGLTPETVQHFGLGYCGRGLMAGRIAIPLRDGEGRLIGYAGRIVDDSQIGEDRPKYRLPGDRERNGTVCGFSKSLFLFNGNCIAAPVSDLIVVEGFFGLFHLCQCGHGNTVALMGSSCSPEQAECIVRLVAPDGRVWLMPDGDEAGRRCAETVLAQIAPHRFVRWITLDEDKDPNDYAREQFAEWFGPTP